MTQSKADARMVRMHTSSLRLMLEELRAGPKFMLAVFGNRQDLSARLVAGAAVQPISCAVVRARPYLHEKLPGHHQHRAHLTS